MVLIFACTYLTLSSTASMLFSVVCVRPVYYSFLLCNVFHISAIRIRGVMILYRNTGC